MPALTKVKSKVFSQGTQDQDDKGGEGASPGFLQGENDVQDAATAQPETSFGLSPGIWDGDGYGRPQRCLEGEKAMHARTLTAVVGDPTKGFPRTRDMPPAPRQHRNWQRTLQIGHNRRGGVSRGGGAARPSYLERKKTAPRPPPARSAPPEQLRTPAVTSRARRLSQRLRRLAVRGRRPGVQGPSPRNEATGSLAATFIGSLLGWRTSGGGKGRGLEGVAAPGETLVAPESSKGDDAGAGGVH